MISLRENIKSVVNKLVLILVFSFLPTSVIAQIKIYGNWEIGNLIGLNDVDEYSMVKQKEFSLGNSLTLNLDGTFSSGYSAKCGNDCFQNTSGRFIFIDEVHIRFILEDIHFSGFCGSNLKTESELNRDLGIFYIYKEANSIRLIKSNGILQDDKDKMLYNKMMDSFNWKLYDFVWENTKGKSREEIVKDYFDHSGKVNFSNCKVVISKKETYGQVILVQQKDNFYFVIYDDFKKKVSLAYPRQ